MPLIMALPLSRGMATMADMKERLSLEDCMDMLEVLTVGSHNDKQWMDWRKHERR